MKKIIYLSLMIILLCCKTEKKEKEFIDSPISKDTDFIVLEVTDFIVLDSIKYKKVLPNIKLDRIDLENFNPE
jgi:hypothetical protein